MAFANSNARDAYDERARAAAGGCWRVWRCARRRGYEHAAGMMGRARFAAFLEAEERSQTQQKHLHPQQHPGGREQGRNDTSLE